MKKDKKKKEVCHVCNAERTDVIQGVCSLCADTPKGIAECKRYKEAYYLKLSKRYT